MRVPVRHKIHRRLVLEPLEERVLLSLSTPTNWDQYLLELVNRARANPLAEAARYGISLNEGLPEGTISTTPKQPVAFNAYLVGASQNHTQWMLDTDTLSHMEGAKDPGERMVEAGYTFNGSSGWGENVGYYCQRPATPDLTWATAYLHQLFFVDDTVPDRGHRIDMLSDNWREAGVGVLPGDWSGYNAVVATEDFTFTTSSAFLTGVVYNDSVLDDDFYTPGEGLGDITIVATRASDGAVFSTTTWSSGGYTLALDPGSYAVTASGSALGSTRTGGTVVIGTQNVKVDFTPDSAVVTPAPDLTVAVVSAPATVTTGSAFDVSWTVRNDGPGTAPGGWLDRLYLSTDATITTSDTLLGTFTRSLSLSSGGQYTATLSATVATPGTWYLGVITDAAGVVRENSETNNTACVATTATAPRLPNLTVSALTAPDSVVAGTAFDVGWTVSNTGAVTAPASWVDHVYLSSDQMITTDDILLGTLAHGLSLAGLSQYGATLTVSAPSGGTWYLGVVTDASQTIAETSDSDNTAVRILEVSPATVTKADLAVTSITTPVSVGPGETFHVSWVVSNLGGSPAVGPWTDEVYLSSDLVISSSDQLLATLRRASLGVQSQYVDGIDISIPTSGTWYVGVLVDTGNAVSEMSEANNRLAEPVAVSVPPADKLPVIGAMSDLPNPVSQGSVLWLHATQVSDPDGSVTAVEFYRDDNLDGVGQPEELLGLDTSGASGWNWHGTVTWPAGDHRYLARAIDDDGMAGNWAEVWGQVRAPGAYLTLGGYSPSKLTYVQADGTAVTISISKGQAEISLLGTNLRPQLSGTTWLVTGSDVWAELIQITHSTTATSLSIQTKGGGSARIGQVVGTRPMGGLIGKTTDLMTGILMTGQGYIGSLQLHDVLDGADILMEGGSPAVGTAFSARSIEGDTHFESASGLKSLKLGAWETGSLAVPWIGSVSVGGDARSGLAAVMGAEVALVGAPAGRATLGRVLVSGEISGRWTVVGSAGSITAGALTDAGCFAATGNVAQIAVRGDLEGEIRANTIGSLTVLGDLRGAALRISGATSPTGAVLGKVSVKGWISRSEIRSRGDVGSITAGGVCESLVFAGVSDGVSCLPDSGAFERDAGISKLTVKGVAGAAWSFESSQIAASRLGRIILRDVECTGRLLGVEFGVAGHTLDSIRFDDGTTTYRSFDPSEHADHLFTVRLV